MTSDEKSHPPYPDEVEFQDRQRAMESKRSWRDYSGR